MKTIIFDLDGTLLDTLTDLAISTNYALKTYNYPCHTVNEIRLMIGNGVAK
ncbi:MAG: HAD hydrolase-like protein, partial [Bacteroidaceae bacterium]